MRTPPPTIDDAIDAIASARARFDFAARELHLMMVLTQLRGVPGDTVTAAARMTPETATALIDELGCGFGARPTT